MYQAFIDIQNNTKNTVTFFQNKKRCVKSFRVLSEDIDRCLQRINELKSKADVNTIGILGPISYFWMLIDLACIKGGIKSVAIPEHLSNKEVIEIVKDNSCDLVLIDNSFRTKYQLKCEVVVFYFNCDNENVDKNFLDISRKKLELQDINILEDYSIVYSSGTSAKLKKITCSFDEKKRNPRTVNSESILSNIRKRIISKIQNTIIIYMPFSHSQQRGFVYKALRNNINIILSDPRNCIKHLIIEKPNLMVSVPAIYEALALRIDKKIESFSLLRRIGHRLFNALNINTLPNSNPLKILCASILYRHVKKVYGGSADYFVSGSAPIKKSTLETFYSIGVRIIEAYGQSESDTIAINDHRKFKIGSVGKPIVDLKISSDSEILIKYVEERHYKNRAALKLTDDGYIRTGDLGELDSDRFLFLKGRLDDVMVLENGKKVFPVELESRFNKYDEIIEAIVFLSEGKHITVVLLVNKSTINPRIEEIVTEVNKEIASFEKIEKYIITSETFSEENGLLTSNQKIIRKAIINRYNKAELMKTI